MELPSAQVWENHQAMKTLYSRCVEEVCLRHGLARTELDILLFLANNPGLDTAAKLIEVRFLCKSHVSLSLKRLEARGLLERSFLPGNRKTVHLRLTEGAQGAVEDGRRAQGAFVRILMKGFSPQEMEALAGYNRRIAGNIQAALKEELQL